MVEIRNEKDESAEAKWPLSGCFLFDINQLEEHGK
jgi:hypothetical protein